MEFSEFLNESIALYNRADDEQNATFARNERNIGGKIKDSNGNYLSNSLVISNNCIAKKDGTDLYIEQLNKNGAILSLVSTQAEQKLLKTLL